MNLEHIVKSYETVQSIAATYWGDATRWRDIVDFNGLDFPYIVTDPNFQKSVPASGVLTLTRTYTSTALLIPAGTLFTALSLNQENARTYTTLSDTWFPVNVGSISVFVACTVTGTHGNVPQGMIQSIQAKDPAITSAISGVTNTAPFTNGKEWNVRMPGDSLLIPDIASAQSAVEQPYTSPDEYYLVAFGEDVGLGEDGDLYFDGYGDVGTVAGVENLAQAVRDRVLTPKLALPYHPEYGSVLEDAVGSAHPAVAQRLAALAIQEALLDDDRVGNVSVQAIQRVDNRTIDVTVSVTPKELAQEVVVPIRATNVRLP